jgi:hypothetical protein
MPYRASHVSFAGGEFSPKLYPRVDIKKYATGLKTCKNFFIHPHGGASNRSGFKYVTAQHNESYKSRLFSHVFSRTQAYILSFGQNYIEFFTDQGQIAVSGADAYNAGTAYAVNDYVTYGSLQYRCKQPCTGETPSGSSAYWEQLDIYKIYTPYLSADLEDLRICSSADVIYITHPDYEPRTLTRYGETDWRLEEFQPDDGPFMPANVDEDLTLTADATTGDGITVTASDDYFTVENVGSLFQFIHYIEGSVDSPALASATSGSAITCFTTWRLVTHGTWTGKLRVEKSTDGGSTWTTLRTFTSADDFNVDTYGTEDPEVNSEPFLVRVNMYDYTSGTCNADLTTDAFYQTGIVRMVSFTSATAMTANVITAIGSTAATYLWSEGSWSERRGWPSDSTFHDDRLVIGPTASEKMTAWASRQGDYSSFGRNAATLLDTDRISINLLSRQLNEINGFLPLTELLAFTSASEWRIGTDDDGVLTPSTVRAKPQGNRGSSGLKPVAIGNQVLYMQASGSALRYIGYDFSTNSYTGTDLSILSDHLFRGYQISDMAYQQSPDSILWLVRDDGVLLALTYMVDQEVVAWSRHETDGTVESVAVVPASGYDELWISVLRNGRRYIERMMPRLQTTDADDQFFVDSGISYDDPKTILNITQGNPAVVSCVNHGFSDGDYVDIRDVEGMTEVNGKRFIVAGATANSFELTDAVDGTDIDASSYTEYASGGSVREAFYSFSGLDHLDERTVSILGDGNVYPQQVVSGGVITLSRRCSIVHVGLPYTADLETLNIEKELSSGTLQGEKIKVGLVSFRFLDSRGGYIGPDFDNLYEAFTPSRSRLSEAPSLFSGIKRQPLGGQYDEGGRVCFRQSDPLPVTITAILPSVRSGV